MNNDQQANEVTALTQMQNNSDRLKELYQKINNDADLYKQIKSEVDYTNWKPLTMDEYNDYIELRADNLRIRDAATQQNTTDILESAGVDLTTVYNLPEYLTLHGPTDAFKTMVNTKPLHDAVQKNQFGEAGSYNSKENAQKALMHTMDSLAI